METGEIAEGGSVDDAAGQGASSMQTFWRAPLPENTNVGGGEQFTWSIETSSEKEYDQIIPLSALREDANEIPVEIVNKITGLQSAFRLLC